MSVGEFGRCVSGRVYSMSVGEFVQYVSGRVCTACQWESL